MHRILRALRPKRIGDELFGNRPWQTPGTRVHFRALELFLIAWAVYFSWEWGVYIDQNISAAPFPEGLARFIDVSFLFDRQVALANAILVGVLGLVGFARVSRYAYGLALLAFHLQYVARFCLGKVEHGSNMIGMGMLALAVASIAFQSEERRRRFTFGFLYFFVGVGYASAAVCKLIGTGLFWPDGHHLLMWIAERRMDVLSNVGSYEPTFIQELVLHDYRVGTLILAFGLVTELSGVLLWWRRVRPWIAFLLVGMHVGIIYTMNISFLASMVLLILIGLPWHRAIDRVWAWRRTLAPWRTTRA